MKTRRTYARFTMAAATVALLCPPPCLAQAQGMSRSATDRLGVSANVDLSYLRIKSRFDSRGDRRAIDDDLTKTYWLLNLLAGYDFAGVAQGLAASLEIPLLRVTFDLAPPRQDASSFGLGDVSAALGYFFYRGTEEAKLGAQIRFKGGTGKATDLAADEAPLGSGHHNLQIQLLAQRTKNLGFGFDADAGYILTFEKTSDGGVRNPGDVLYAELGISYRVSDRLQPRLLLLSQVRTANRSKDAGETSEKSDAAAYGFSVMLDATYALTTTLTAYAAWGTSTISRGYNLRTGLPLAGKNMPAPNVALTTGVRGAW